jgi:hypothetical protein
VKAEDEARARQAVIDAELGGRKDELDRERRERDAADEAKIKASEAALKAAGVTDKETAVNRAVASVTGPTCVECGKSLMNSGKFVRVGDQNVPYENRDPIHTTCLQCKKCGAKGASSGIDMVDGVLTCFNCRPQASLAQIKQSMGTSTAASTAAPAAAPGGGNARFCAECGSKRVGDSKFCSSCGKKYE